jgi:hypothetical protein
VIPLRPSSVELAPITDFDSVGAFGRELAMGSGEAHVHFSVRRVTSERAAMQRSARRCMFFVAAAVLGGCAHPRLATRGYNISSERSDYSPTVRLAVALPVISPVAPAIRSRSPSTAP